MNKNFFKRNLEGLRIHYPCLYEKLFKYKPSKKYVITQKKSGYNLFIPEEDRFYYESQEPYTSVLEEFKEKPIKYSRLIFLLGFGLGYEYKAFLDLYSKELDVKKLVIVEKELEVFYYALHLNDLSKLINNKDVYFFVDLSEKELIDEFGKIAWRDFEILIYVKTLKVIASKASLLIDGNYYNSAFRNMKNAMVHKITVAGNDVEDSLWGISNMLENLDEIIRNPGLKNLFGKFKNKPAVVVASGPSLDKNIHHLKGMEDKVLIICADSALRILRRHGITPHLTVMIERPKHMAKLFEPLEPEDMRNTYLVAAGVVHKEVYKTYQGGKFIVYPPHKPFQWLGIDKGYTNIRLSAGNMTFQVAELLGANPILIAGQDLSFGENEKTHATGMPMGENVQAEIQRKRMEVKGNYKEKVLTHEIWYRFLECYEEDARSYIKRGGKVINCTAGGAYIDGTILGDLKACLDMYAVEGLNPHEIILNAIQEEEDIDEKDTALGVVKLIDKTINDINYYIHCCDHAQAIYNKYGRVMEPYMKDKKEELTDEILVEFEKIGKEIMRLKKCMSERKFTYINFFMHIFQPYMLNFEIKAQDIPNLYDDRRIAYIHQILYASQWFQNLRGISKITVYLLKKGKNNIIESFNLDLEPEDIKEVYNLSFEKL